MYTRHRTGHLTLYLHLYLNAGGGYLDETLQRCDSCDFLISPPGGIAQRVLCLPPDLVDAGHVRFDVPTLLL